MDSDDDLLVSMLDSLEEEGNEEDWTDTSWAQPVTHVATLLHSGTSSGNMEHVMGSTKTDMKPNNEPDDPSVVKRMLLNDNKAGMEGLDKERINQIIHEASKGSKFYENERLKEEQMKKRIEEQRKKVSTITESQLKEGLTEADRLLEDFDQQRDLSHTIVHIDMDAFYAAVEMRDRPELKDKPMAVGGNSMLSTSNYLARKFGVRAAMPGFIGKKLCPDLVLVSQNFDKYTAVSKDVRAIFTQYDPNFCPMSLDEAYLDITEHLEQRKTMSELERTFICRDRAYADSEKYCLCDLNDISKTHERNSVSTEDVDSIDLHSYLLSEKVKSQLVSSNSLAVFGKESCDDGRGEKRPSCPVCHKEFPPFSCQTFGLMDEDAVHELRTRIEQKTRLTASAGIAPNMMLAKVCSDKNKPNGQFKVPATKEDVIRFIKDLPTRKISGIGKVSEAMLNALGVYTCTDLYDRRALLYHLYSPISFNYFMRICLGIGSTRVERDSERKSMSTERTFSELSRPADLYRKCEELCESLATDLKDEQLKGKTLGLKIKTVKFEVKTKAQSLREYTNDKKLMLPVINDLLKTEIQACAPHPLRLRLMGVRMSNLLSENHCIGKKQNTITGAFKKLTERKKEEEVSTCPRTSCVRVEESKSVHTEINTENENKLNRNPGDNCPGIESTESCPGIESTESCPGIDSTESCPGIESTESCPGIESTESCPGIECAYSKGVIGCFKGFVKDEEIMEESIERTVDGNNSDQIPVLEGVPLLIESESQDNDSIHRQCAKDETVDGILTAENKKESFHMVGVKEDCDVRAVRMVCEKSESQNNDFVASDNSHSIQVVNEVGKDLNRIEIVSEIQSHQPDGEITTSAIVTTPKGRTTRSGLVCSVERKVKQRRNSKKDKMVSYSCPVCVQDVQCYSLTEFNNHVDECLESQANTAAQSLQCDDMKNVPETVKNTDVTVPRFGFNHEQTSSSECLRETSVSVDSDLAKTDHGSAVVDRSKTHRHQDQKSLCDNVNEMASCTKEKVETKEDNVPEKYNEESVELRNDVFRKPEKIPQNQIETNCNTDTVLKTTEEITDLSSSDPVTPRPELEDGVKSTQRSEMPYQHECYSGQAITENFLCDTTDIERNIPKSCVSKPDAVKENSVFSEEVNNNNAASCSKDITSNLPCDPDSDCDEQSQGLLVCPVCNIEQRSASLVDFNDHVDSCLSRGTITEILREQRNKGTYSQKRHSTSPVTPGSSQPSKRRKTVLPHQSVPCRSIVSFFKDK